MNDLQNAGYYEVIDPEDLEFTFGDIADDITQEKKEVIIPYSGVQLSAVYSNTFFNTSSYNYNHNLAWLSLCLELSAFTDNENATWGASGENVAAQRCKNLATAYDELEFNEEDITYYNYDVSLNASEDKVAFSIAKKQNVCGATLVTVVVRGGGYGAEWCGNFNVGNGNDYHVGFNTAADGVYREVLNKLSQIDGNVKLWVVGYSRGAAVANLLAAKLDDYSQTSDQYDAKDLFTYTFATPQGVVSSSNTSSSLYNNIFNIVNPGDYVPQVVLSRWNFTRYGVTRCFDAYASDETFNSVNLTYASYRDPSDDFFDARSNMNQSASVTAMVDFIASKFPKTEDTLKIQPVSKDSLSIPAPKLIAKILVNRGPISIYRNLLNKYWPNSSVRVQLKLFK